VSWNGPFGTFGSNIMGSLLRQRGMQKAPVSRFDVLQCGKISNSKRCMPTGITRVCLEAQRGGLQAVRVLVSYLRNLTDRDTLIRIVSRSAAYR
jgi:hypothetical protein